MGDPRRFKKTYARPFKPWDDTRIAEEKILLKDYGLVNKKEMWKAESLLRRFKAQAKKLIATRGPQAELEKQQLLTRLASLGLTDQNANLDTVLGLTINNVLNRRLQTFVFNRKLARTITQSRQFIVHEHITVSGRKIAVPSYLVRRNEEDAITFSSESSLASDMHPERGQKKPGTPADANGEGAGSAEKTAEDKKETAASDSKAEA